MKSFNKNLTLTALVTSTLRMLRPLEPRMGWIGLGAQYRMAARKPM